MLNVTFTNDAAEMPPFEGENSKRHIVVVSLCLTYFLVLSFQHGIRYGQMRGKQLKSNLVEVLLQIQFFATLAIILTVALLEIGLSIVTDARCYAAAMLCLIFFGIGKIALNLIFNEQVYDLRNPHVRRIRDPIWLTSMAGISGSFAALVFFIATTPWAQLDPKTGQCSIIYARGAVIVIPIFLMAVGIYLIGAFMCILWPVLRSKRMRSPTTASEHLAWQSEVVIAEGIVTRQQKEKFCRDVNIWVAKYLIGWITMLALTVINMVVYVSHPPAKKSHVCLLSCLSDAAWSMFVTSWLTNNCVGGERKNGIAKQPWQCGTWFRRREGSIMHRLKKGAIHPIPEISEHEIQHHKYRRNTQKPYGHSTEVTTRSNTDSSGKHQNASDDSWTEYMDMLSRGPATKFDMNFIEAIVPHPIASQCILPNIPDESR